MSVVYFIKDESSGLIKIGRTSIDVRKRLSALRTASPHPLSVLGTLQEEIYTEAQLHDRFASARKSREWFSPSNDLVNFISENATPYVSRKRNATKPVRSAAIAVDAKDICLRMCSYLREKYPTGTAKAVSRDIGLAVYAVEKWLVGRSVPSLPVFYLLGKVYGASFCAAVFPDWEFAQMAAIDCLAEKLESEIAERERHLAELRN